ncbi:MAG: response regulator [Clostridiales bacterium]|nr:response regulator [Clostridiales bacterium]
MRIYLVDDDEAIVSMLENIIIDYDLGQIVGKALDGMHAKKDIQILKPDIVIVDLLLPKIDGIELVNNFKSKNCSIQFIMLSQVSSKNMIGDAYKAGIEFFINKPINVIEVKSVLEKAIENANLKEIINKIQMTVNTSRRTDEIEYKDNEKFTQVNEILSDLGISNERGGRDILNIVKMIIETREELGRKFHRYNIGDLYNDLNKMYIDEEYKGSFNVRAIEQRVRRTIQQAMDNVSMLGIEDFSNYKFERYSSRLFDFIEVKRNMDFIREKTKYRGKISVKTFIEGLIGMVED